MFHGPFLTKVSVF